MSPRRNTPPRDASAAFVTSAATASEAPARLYFRLYVAGPSDKSTRAIRNARDLCDGHFGGTAALEVIDIIQQPGRARLDQILAVPALIKHMPLPVKRFIGDLSNRVALLAGLGLAAAAVVTPE